MNEILDGVAAVFMVVGASMSLAAAIGLITFPDLLTRMHAATKPQVFGLLLLLLAVALAMRAWTLLPLLVLMWMFQLLTIPVGGHMVARAGYRVRRVDRDALVIDDLRDVVQAAGAAPDGAEDGGATAADPPPGRS
ncbi:Na+/H+ antiporter subunit G [Tersicoccus solisilvae]|uniref:Na+/H+ antiporter subunit G n=1 Tax=Tersicoccus solisilvae TaxID=1882339 RepID=A0ABQ1NQG2_9MICC|nr:monovalent cation/H(+) antiporter subunit G [Tersicoccus solisilvae]GGC80390.1 Na+/H+ antiporter subunit G [Tersicoccus solisilvae]